jgi:hypothetical protein
MCCITIIREKNIRIANFILLRLKIILIPGIFDAL